jgi:hypothetical protein
MVNRRDWLGTVGAGALALGAELVAPPGALGEGGAGTLTFAELYKARSVLGLELSGKVQALSGRPVQLLGYMAPPLKAETGFFVLTRAPVALCPFCNSDADWPSDIVVVYPRDRAGWTQDGLPVAVSGVLDLGSKTDPQTGFVSLVRIVDAEVRTIR